MPNPNNQIVQIANGHRGRRCIRNKLLKIKASLQTLLDHSFIHNGPKLFNCLPSGVHNLTASSEITLKNNLDKFLKTIGYKRQTAGRKYKYASISCLELHPGPTNGYQSSPFPLEERGQTSLQASGDTWTTRTPRKGITSLL